MVPEQEQEQQEPALEIKRKAKTREERTAQNKEKCERISHYLHHGKHLPGLTKNQQRIVRELPIDIEILFLYTCNIKIIFNVVS